MSAIKPRLFISYAREDEAIAEAVNAHLQKDYKTFFDKKNILIGDLFPEKIRQHIKKCDGCIAIISPSSVASEWCKLELYFAHLLRKSIIPVKIGTADFGRDNPLEHLQKGINYTIVEDNSRLPGALSLIDEKLKITRRSAWRRIFIMFSWTVLAALLIYALFSSIDSFTYNNARSAMLGDVRRSDRILTDSAMEIPLKKFNNDQWLIAQLHLMEADPVLPGAARINS
ncbi:MAG TPA: toll/interleukin-1 receptor domain-containing protein, partial [Chitinophagaceae bacterium]|nr:toll/interleukin-1 receptor domain-containing protein [Chitinophagaceae bacterium]